MHHYDYIFLGSGAASLSLLMRMLDTKEFNKKKILLVDKSAKTTNDRTWCYWEKDKGYFEEIVYKKWDHLFFHSKTFSAALDTGSYQYKMIRGIDFYQYCFDKISKQKNVEILYADISFDRSDILLNGNKLDKGNAIIFNSIYQPASDDRAITLLQHFKGWIIETNTPFFDEEKAVLMDFRIAQDYGTSFVYVLPLNEKKCLVEYTLFTEQLLEKEQYEDELRNYVKEWMQIDDYNVSEEEFGIIPMTGADFSFYKKGMFHIGMAGGQTKPSTGYTFQFIQKRSEQILNCLSSGGSLEEIPKDPSRFLFYDRVMLQLLYEKKLAGEEIFSRLFERNKAHAIFKFLDNESSLPEELRLIRSLQFFPFLKAAVRTGKNLFY